ncbi:Gpi1-domain-containing protein [Aureobasidium pullulans]|nr:Gpi1-domain-containing protein [Aureobasidium pullulans]THX54157.1 Gpi1-domain-containing protein [Aureobasidium pullulans]THX67287.1 Gpi1-domain-containing protein [Aureobasidium pullulans]THZ51064.1 Gpi1-domain-containing protein [Aureobasidium pullulans]TIA56218.1 Gpi1-domain-containing protein [Aureobasidium pullulans]
MHPFSVLTLGIFVAGYITARWDLVTRLYELAIFAWDHGVITRSLKAFLVLTIFFIVLIVPIERIAARESDIAFMIAPNGLMRIFWPTDIARSDKAGVVIGWRNSDLDMVVVAILREVDAHAVGNTLKSGRLFHGSPHPIDRILDRCGRLPLQVLGTLNPERAPSLNFDPSSIQLYYTQRHAIPQVHCPGAPSISIQIVTFDRPNPHRMQYLSLSPIPLTLSDAQERAGKTVAEGFGADEAIDRARKQQLVDKLRMHTVVHHARTSKELVLPVILNQINCSYEIDELVRKNIGFVGSRTRRSMSVSERMAESAADLWDYTRYGVHHAFFAYVYPVVTQLLVLALVGHRIAGEAWLRILEWRPIPDSAALKDVSATAQQIDIRLQQFCYWPIQYLTLRKRRTDWGSVTNSHPEYIRFYNSLWLVANDIIIGIAIGSYIIENSDYVAGQVESIVDSWFIEGLQRMICWLMGYPGGLKLNEDLAQFLGDLFLWIIDYWAECMQSIRPLLPHVIRVIGFSSFAGASMPISLFSDLLSVLTIHVYAFYIASARIYNWQLTIIVSLFHLFRGKKRNVLRNRIDSCDYDLDQLLLGTILFALLTFLLPTIGVFYATFAGARMGIIAFKAALDTWLACLNHFPLFALMLRIKDSRRLPGGIRFELRDTPLAFDSPHQRGSVKPDIAPTAHIQLQSVPLPFSETFSQYSQLAYRIRKHYLSPSVFLCLFTGRFVPPIHRKSLYSLQYSMLPAKRIPIAELWKKLMGSDGARKPQANGTASSSTGRRGQNKKDPGHWWSK